MAGDLNAAMKIFIGAQMIANALHLHLIPAKCYGSCPGCTAMQMSLTCTLTTDITKQSWATLAVASVDFCTCYDSVAHPPLSIACQHLGMACSVLETIFSTIQNTRIFLCMAHGNSSIFYGNPPTEGLPFQGVCQGNGAGPALWLATSIPMIEMLCHQSHVSSLQCPVSQQSSNPSPWLVSSMLMIAIYLSSFCQPTKPARLCKPFKITSGSGRVVSKQPAAC